MKMMEWKFKIENNSEIKDINVRRELNQIAGNQFVRNTKKGIRNTAGSIVKRIYKVVQFEFFREIIIKGRVEFENRNHNSNPYNLCNS